jgi:hypothetical protein
MCMSYLSLIFDELVNFWAEARLDFFGRMDVVYSIHSVHFRHLSLPFCVLGLRHCNESELKVG